MTTAEDAWEQCNADMETVSLDAGLGVDSSEDVQRLQIYFDDAEAQQRIYLQAANAQRDAVVTYFKSLVELNLLSKNQFNRIGVVTAAWDPKTGAVNVGIKIMIKGGAKAGDPLRICAEDMACSRAVQQGSDAATLQYTEAINPKTGEPWPICSSCQGKITESQVSVSGAKGDPRGPWYNKLGDMSDDINQEVSNVQGFDSNFDLKALDDGTQTPSDEAPSGAEGVIDTLGGE